MAAFQAQTEMDPAIANLQALFAAAAAGSDWPDLIEMSTGCHVLSSFKDGTDNDAQT
jgi:hypothetical protein